jgi:hypothetical protein
VALVMNATDVSWIGGLLSQMFQHSIVWMLGLLPIQPVGKQ